MCNFRMLDYYNHGAMYIYFSSDIYLTDSKYNHVSIRRIEVHMRKMICWILNDAICQSWEFKWSVYNLLLVDEVC